MTATNDHEGKPGPPPTTRPSPWPGVLIALRWPLMLAVVVVLGLAALERGCRSVWRGQREAVETVGEAAANIAQRFSSGTITTTFVAALPRLAPDSGLKLELAAFEATEILETPPGWLLLAASIRVRM